MAYHKAQIKNIYMMGELWEPPGFIQCNGLTEFPQEIEINN